MQRPDASDILCTEFFAQDSGDASASRELDEGSVARLRSSLTQLSRQLLSRALMDRQDDAKDVAVDISQENREEFFDRVCVFFLNYFDDQQDNPERFLPLRVRFHREQGVDAGGLTNQLFTMTFEDAARLFETDVRACEKAYLGGSSGWVDVFCGGVKISCSVAVDYDALIVYIVSVRPWETCKKFIRFI
jgi:hypothetical protein